ncbi:hypothetical protein EOA79_24065 [Mesorhizobium sp. M1A.F.Ca.IN.020.03.2.1]|uniref:hypothetical protein n=1 Tax=Mesorhizobium sp. M1A.F.Ca.IN.020.03.2.1 TaxID=2496769 RepID=UPI000FD4D923|nr:hypothetical protein [Mesorhizobium sp. M1A.F.Ca.IN.020.03.2.1]RUU97968.1 hypothetical protein EOA79_24065 [Mesorhizobium sp. M1A.F.Ca.IN.020.03.2.1]
MSSAESYNGPEMINPAHEAYPEEARLIGLMVIGYSELDISLCLVGGLALGHKWAVLDALHTIKDEGTRLDVVGRLVRHIMVEKTLEPKFGETIGAMRYCKTVRNQYAHAQWANFDGMLRFTSTRDIHWRPDGGPTEWKAVDPVILRAQEAYFEYTRKCLLWLTFALEHPGKAIRWPEHMEQPPKQWIGAV